MSLKTREEFEREVTESGLASYDVLKANAVRTLVDFQAQLAAETLARVTKATMLGQKEIAYSDLERKFKDSEQLAKDLRVNLERVSAQVNTLEGAVNAATAPLKTQLSDAQQWLTKTEKQLAAANQNYKAMTENRDYFEQRWSQSNTLCAAETVKVRELTQQKSDLEKELERCKSSHNDVYSTLNRERTELQNANDKMSRLEATLRASIKSAEKDAHAFNKQADDYHERWTAAKEEVSKLLTQQSKCFHMDKALAKVFGGLLLLLVTVGGGFMGGMTYEDRVLKELSAKNKRLEAEHTRMVSTIDNFADVCVVSGSVNKSTAAQLKSLVGLQALEHKSLAGTFEVLPVHDDAHIVTATGTREYFYVCKLGYEYKALSLGVNKPESARGEGQVREGEWVAITAGHPLWTKYQSDMAERKRELTELAERRSDKDYESRVSSTRRLAEKVSQVNSLRYDIRKLEEELAKEPEGTKADTNRQLLSSLQKHEKALVSIVAEQKTALEEETKALEKDVRIELEVGE